MQSPTADGVPSEASVYAKVTRRLIPLLFVCYVVAYLDRVNVGFAKLQMVDALQFSDAVYGFGAGIFFIGYFLFEVPSNLLLERLGARVWIARIMITWSLVSGASRSWSRFHGARCRRCSDFRAWSSASTRSACC